MLLSCRSVGLRWRRGSVIHTRFTTLTWGHVSRWCIWTACLLILLILEWALIILVRISLVILLLIPHLIIVLLLPSTTSLIILSRATILSLLLLVISLLLIGTVICGLAILILLVTLVWIIRRLSKAIVVILLVCYIHVLLISIHLASIYTNSNQVYQTNRTYCIIYYFYLPSRKVSHHYQSNP